LLEADAPEPDAPGAPPPVNTAVIPVNTAVIDAKPKARRVAPLVRLMVVFAIAILLVMYLIFADRAQTTNSLAVLPFTNVTGDRDTEYLSDGLSVGGNVKDGCHIASMGGTWMVAVYGFGGLRDYDGTLCFRPHRPPQAELQFSITHRGQLLDVEITPGSTRYSLRKGERVVFHQ
jgi:hypothetical protein